MPRFLIIRLSSIGDIVLTSPVVRCLKKQVPEAEVHFLTKEKFIPAIRHNPYVDKVIAWEQISHSVKESLKKEHYDFIIDLHHNLRTLKIKSSLKAKAISFSKLNFQKWLLVNFKIDWLPDKHIVDRYLETLREFKVMNDGEGLDYFITDEDEQIVNQTPELGKPYMALVIGAAHYTKKIPEEKLIAICNELQQPIVLLGGKDEASSAWKIISGSLNKNIINGCGLFTLNQSAAFIKHADTVITPDTGLMHMAAAYRKKIVSVWGNTVPRFGMYPYLPQGGYRIIENNNLSCRPCSKIGFDQCPKGHFNCMNWLDPRTVSQSAKTPG